MVAWSLSPMSREDSLAHESRRNRYLVDRPFHVLYISVVEGEFQMRLEYIYTSGIIKTTSVKV